QASWKSIATPHTFAAPAESDEIHAPSCGVQALRKLQFRETMDKKGSDYTKPFTEAASRVALRPRAGSHPERLRRVHTHVADALTEWHDREPSSCRERMSQAAEPRNRRLHDRPKLAPSVARSSSSCSNVSLIASAAPVPAASRASFEG